MARENKKDLILQTAIELFYSKGFKATTTAEIASKAGIAEGTIFRHYKTKKDILLSVFENFIEKFGQIVVLEPLQEIIDNNKNKDIKEILKMVMKDRLAFFEQNSEILWIIITEMKYHPELKHVHYENILKEGMSIINHIFVQGIESGVFRKCDPVAALRAFLGTTIIIGLQYKVFPQLLPSIKSLDETIDEALDLFINGLLEEGQN